MEISNAAFSSDVRKVSGRCLLNGHDVPFVSFSVESNAFRGAATFDLTLAITALPADMQILSWWGRQTAVTVELFASVITQSGTDEKKLITGNIDTWHYDPARFEVTAEGRDFTARLIDARSAGESFKNYTSSQIATMLAQRHGLTPVVTATSRRFGEFYQTDTAHLTGEQNDWDLMSTLAGIENFAVYVENDRLHFEPVSEPGNAGAYVIRWQPPGQLAYPRCNTADDLSFSRALTISKGVTVEVLSWNAKRKNKQFVASYPKAPEDGTPGGAMAKTQVYRVIRNGLSPESANMLAQTIYRNIVQHEMKFSCSMAGDNMLMPRMLVRIEGTQSPFDQLYWCDSVRRTLSQANGYTMHLSGKNHSPALEVLR